MRTQEEILRQSKIVASVGISTSPKQVANSVSRLLQNWGYTVIPVNPDFDEVIDQKCYPDLLSVPKPIDIVAIFRRSQNVAPHVDQAIAIGASAVWMPISVVDETAAARARAAGLDVVMDRCMHCAIVELGLFPEHSP